MKKEPDITWFSSCHCPWVEPGRIHYNNNNNYCTGHHVSLDLDIESPNSFVDH